MLLCTHCDRTSPWKKKWDMSADKNPKSNTFRHGCMRPYMEKGKRVEDTFQCYEVLFVELPCVISNPLAVFRDERHFIPYFPESEMKDYVIQRTDNDPNILAITSRKHQD